MKMLKKLSSCLMAVMLAASVACMPLVAFGETVTPNVTQGSAVVSDWDNDNYCMDFTGTLSADVQEDFVNAAQDIARQHGVGVYFVYTDTYGSGGGRAYCDSLYEQADLGVGKNGSAILMTVALQDHEYYGVLYGDAITAISESTFTRIRTDMESYLSRSDWEGAADNYLANCTAALASYKPQASGSSRIDPSSINYTEGTYVIDAYGLLSDSQRASLEAQAKEYASKYNMGVYLLVVNDIGYKSATDYATAFYRAKNLGLGSGRDGILFLIAVDSRDYVTIAYCQGSYSFSDDGIDEMEEAVVDRLKGNLWTNACEEYYKQVGEQLAYYQENGKAYVPKSPFDFILKLLAILGVPGLVAGSVVGSEKRGMKTAREQFAADNYVDDSSLKLTVCSDTFVNTTLAVTAKPDPDDDHGSGWSGGGSWGGGGGGGFSSSGGGKF